MTPLSYCPCCTYKQRTEESAAFCPAAVTAIVPQSGRCTHLACRTRPLRGPIRNQYWKPCVLDSWPRDYVSIKDVAWLARRPHSGSTIGTNAFMGGGVSFPVSGTLPLLRHQVRHMRVIK